MKNINRIAFLNILSILLLQGISFISSPLFSRLLGTDGFGTMTYFNVWAGVLGTVLTLQSNVTIVNARVEYPEGEQPAYQSAIMTMSLLAFGVGTAVIFALMGPISGLLQMERVVIAVMLLQCFGSFGVSFLSSKFTYEFKADKNLFLSVFMAAASMGVSLLIVLNVPVEQRYFGRVLGNALVYGAVGFVGCAFILLRGKCYWNRKYWKFCFALAWPLIFQNLSYVILGDSDLMMLNRMAGAAESGIYGLAFTLAGIIFTIFTALNNSWTPFFFDDMKENRRENAVRQASNFLELFTVLAMGFVLLVREVYHIYAPEEFWPGIDLLPIFVGSYYANFLCTFPVNFEFFHKKTRVIAAATVVSALINLGLNYVFILKFGMMGAAVATLLAHLIQLAIHEIYVRCILAKRDYLFPLTVWLKYAAAFAASVALFYATPDSWYVRWPLGAAVGLFELYRMWKRKGLL